MPLSERLRFARTRIQLTGVRVEELTGIQRSSISAFESGQREPSLAQLHKLATVFHRPIAFFLEDGPLPVEVVLWRDKPSDEIAGELETDFLQFCRQYRNLEVWCGEKAQKTLPGVTERPRNYRQAEVLATNVRQELQLGDRPAQVLLSVLDEVCAVKILHLSFEPTGAAASTLSDEFGPAVLLNSNTVRWRRNFDLAHELFHLVTWPGFHPSDVGAAAVDQQEEKFAQAFAGALLMPDEALKAAMAEHQREGKLTFEELFDIARQFDVSMDALLWRLHFLFGRAEQETKADIERAHAFGAILDRRTDTRPDRVPDRYTALAARAFRRGNLSTGRFAQYMGISRDQAMRFEQQEGGDDEEISLPPD